MCKKGQNGSKLLLFIDNRPVKVYYGIRRDDLIYLSNKIHNGNCSRNNGKVLQAFCALSPNFCPKRARKNGPKLHFFDKNHHKNGRDWYRFIKSWKSLIWWYCIIVVVFFGTHVRIIEICQWPYKDLFPRCGAKIVPKKVLSIYVDIDILWNWY